MAYYVPYMTAGGKHGSRPALKRVVRDGAVQRAFKEQIVPKMTACTAKAKGVYNVADRKEIFAQCAADIKGMKLNLGR